MKILRRVFFSIIFVLVLITPSISLAQALYQDSDETTVSEGIAAPKKMMIAPDYPGPRGGSLPFAGQNHSYSVVMRGNGEAIITLKVALSNTNPDENHLSKISLRLPSRIIPSDISVYQIIAQGYCLRYEERIYNPQMPNYYSSPRCIEYSDPDYFSYYGGGKYQRAKYEYAGDTLTVNLPVSIAPDKTGAFFVYFRAMGYARKNLAGAYKYNFESFKASDAINQMNIGISTDSDLYLKGSKGEVDYRYADTSVMMLKEAGGAAAPVANSAIDRVVSQTGQGTIVKNASNLAPLESYKVSGMYANSRVKLYGKEIVLTLAFVLILAAVVILVFRKIFRSMSVPAVISKKSSALSSKDPERAKLIMISLGISFIASLVFAGYTILVAVVSNNLGYIDYQMGSLLRLIGIIFSFCVYAVILFIPGIYFGYKKGMGWGILTVVLTVFWLFVYFVFAVGAIFFFGYQESYPVMPMMLEGIRK